MRKRLTWSCYELSDKEIVPIKEPKKKKIEPTRTTAKTISYSPPTLNLYIGKYIIPVQNVQEPKD